MRLNKQELQAMLKNNQKIPEGWSVKKLGLCLSLLKDGTHGTHIDVPNGIMLLSAKDVINGQIILSKDSRKISIGDFNLLHKKYHIQNGDVVLTIVGTIGRCAIIDNYNDNYTFQRSVAILRPYKEITSKYLLTYIQGSSFQKELLKRQSVSAQPGVYLDDLSKIYLLLPPLAEQEKIAEILGTWDKAIEKLSSLIEQKKLLKKGLMQKLLTGKVRLPGFTQPWKEVKLDEIGTTYMGLSGKNKDNFGQGSYFIPYMNIYQNNRINPQQLELVEVGEGEKQNIVKYGDIFFTTSSETPKEVGFASVLLFKPEQNIYLNSFCFGYRLNDFQSLLPEYASFLFRSTQARKIMYKLAQGATRFNLSKNELMKEKIYIPSNISEQHAIAEVLSTADDEINLLNQKLEATKEQKKGLMQQLLTGNIRVKVN